MDPNGGCFPMPFRVTHEPPWLAPWVRRYLGSEKRWKKGKLRWVGCFFWFFSNAERSKDATCFFFCCCCCIISCICVVLFAFVVGAVVFAFVCVCVFVAVVVGRGKVQCTTMYYWKIVNGMYTVMDITFNVSHCFLWSYFYINLVLKVPNKSNMDQKIYCPNKNLLFHFLGTSLNHCTLYCLDIDIKVMSNCAMKQATLVAPWSPQQRATHCRPKLVTL